jgi:FOG: GGDEF domain
MSLFRRIWLAVIGLTVAAFAASLLVNTFTARSYLEKQLYLKNVDNATALALSMSQIREKDPVTIELLLSAQFDTGHYQEIRLTDPTGKVVAERKQEAAAAAGAPAWFVKLFPISARPGIAHVQDGWKQFGTITLASQSKFAYQDLWKGTLELSIWFLAGGLVAGLIGTLMLRLITRPLDHVVEQAHAITRRQFISVELPKVPELRSVVQAMNDMVARVKQMFADEAARLESLRRQVNHDSVTGLPNREFFIGYLREALSGEEGSAVGLLAIIRLADLNNVNARLGHARADGLLQLVAKLLNEACAVQNNWLAARVRGSDFALLAPGADDPQPWPTSLPRPCAMWLPPTPNWKTCSILPWWATSAANPWRPCWPMPTAHWPSPKARDRTKSLPASMAMGRRWRLPVKAGASCFPMPCRSTA